MLESVWLRRGQSMVYRVIVTKRAEELIDKLVNYLLLKLKNKQAAFHLLDGIEKIYDRLEDNPLQFPICQDIYLESKGYREAIIPEMEYIIVFHVVNDEVIIMGAFHQLEKYQIKL